MSRREGTSSPKQGKSTSKKDSTALVIPELPPGYCLYNIINFMGDGGKPVHAQVDSPGGQPLSRGDAALSPETWAAIERYEQVVCDDYTEKQGKASSKDVKLIDTFDKKGRPVKRFPPGYHMSICADGRVLLCVPSASGVPESRYIEHDDPEVPEGLRGRLLERYKESQAQLAAWGHAE